MTKTNNLYLFSQRNYQVGNYGDSDQDEGRTQTSRPASFLAEKKSRMYKKTKSSFVCVINYCFFFYKY